jgi:hypothetical protein
VLVWFLYVLLTRWNGVPADPSGAAVADVYASPPIDPARDRTRELVAALNALPPEPAFTLPPPPKGRRWKATSVAFVHPGDALGGEWTPATRPHLQAVIDYLNTPAVQDVMSQLESIEPGGWRPFGPNGVGIPAVREIRQSVTLFVVRARYRHAGLNDVNGALADLTAAYGISSTAFDSGELLGFLTALACESRTDVELQHLVQEHALPLATTHDIVRVIRATALSRGQMWRAEVEASAAGMERVLDLAYTDDRRGNGWLVLSYLDRISPNDWAASPRCGAWNALSLLFNNRRTVAAKIAAMREAHANVADLPYPEAVAALEEVGKQQVFGIADGILENRREHRLTRRYFDLITHKVARRRATLMATALSAYRHDHGRYPSSLNALLDGYLDPLPQDPCVDRPLRYRLQESDKYLVYSVGPDLRDDGAREPPPGTVGRVSEQGGDWILTRDRPKAYFEPELVEVDP